MREIKFRAWDKQNNKMCEPDAFFIFTGSEVLLLNPHHKDTTYYKIDTQTERFVQMQFTGLKDKNDKEIYEGDIVRFSGNDMISEFKGVVKYEYIRFTAEDVEGEIHDALDFVTTMIEIIGNIYENPELLKN